MSATTIQQFEASESVKAYSEPVPQDLMLQAPSSSCDTAMRMETEVNVITLNCWGIFGVSKDRVPRMQAISAELASGKYDFAFLQEVWTTEDYERIKSKTEQTLPYSHYFYSGVIGAGICIFSKSQITSAFFHQWAVNGYVHKIQHGDWFGGKGIGLAQVLHNGLIYNLYTTHLHAEYDRINDEYLAHRVTQAFDTAQFIGLTSQGADVVIVGGDLNTEPGDLAYRLMVHTAELKDTYFERPKQGDTDVFCTCEVPGNSYTSQSSLKSNPLGKRIDYILYNSNNRVKVTTTACGTPLPKLVSNCNFSYSDHEAVVARLRVAKSSSFGPHSFSNDSKKEALEESIEICTEAMKHLASSKRIYYILGTISLLLLIVSTVLTFDSYLEYVLNITRILLLLILLFSIFMSVIWNRMEIHGILAGKLTMEMELRRILTTGQSFYAQVTDRRKSIGAAYIETPPPEYYHVPR